VMAVTFTAKAAGEMRGRLRALGVDGVSARTFHAAALAQLNYFWPTLAGDTMPGIVDNKVRLLAHAADGMGLSPDVATLRDVASGIEWRKVTMRSVEEYAAARPSGIGGLTAERVVDLHRAYEKLKDERRQLDFEDVLLACAGMLEAEPHVARSVHEQYRHFTVDEFQDVSPLQHRLLELWLGDRRDLCVVGDASQTIYSFTGADARFLLEFASRHDGARVVRLQKNYRSDASVLAVANELMRDRPGALQLVARDDRQTAADSPTVTAFDDDEEEAWGVAARIVQQIAAGIDPRRIAVLYRAHAQSAELVAALADVGVAATVLGGRRFFDLPEVRQAVMELRAATVAPIETGFVDTVRDVLRSRGLTDEPPAAGGALRDAWEARAALLRLAEEAPAGTTLRGFTDELTARAKAHDEPALRTVTLATLHAAKGLEWDHVHIIGVSEGLLPISYATTFEQVDEERRLAYVGITRAGRTLSLSWARGLRDRQPSRFLREIGSGTLRAVGARERSGAESRRAVSATGSTAVARGVRPR
jgi:DNA helicase-2/ATP-dependent DNA helicase PcrA